MLLVVEQSLLLAEEVDHLALPITRLLELTKLQRVLILEDCLGRREDVLPIRDLHRELRVRLREGIHVREPVREIRDVLGVEEEVDARRRPGHVRRDGTLIEPRPDLLVACPGLIELRLGSDQVGRDLLKGGLLLLDIRRGVVQLQLGRCELAPDVGERVFDHLEPVLRALDVLFGGRGCACSRRGDRYQDQERRDNGSTSRSGELSSGLGHVLDASGPREGGRTGWDSLPSPRCGCNHPGLERRQLAGARLKTL